MTFEALESFRVFARTLNFTHAAEARHLSQPALHKQIQNLGEQLGVQLYRRAGRSLHLTDAGIQLARFARELGDRTDHFRAQLRVTSTPTKVTLAAGRGSLLYLLDHSLRAFDEHCPQRLRILTTNQPKTLDALRSGEAHLGVTVLNEPPPDLHTELLQEITPRLIVAAHHPLASRKSIRLKTLDRLPLICPPVPSPMREMIAGRMQAAGLNFHPVMDAEGWELLMHFASLGLGASIVNGCCRPPDGTVAIRIPELPKTRYYLVSHRDEFSFPELQSLRSCILEHARNVHLFD